MPTLVVLYSLLINAVRQFQVIRFMPFSLYHLSKFFSSRQREFRTVTPPFQGFISPPAIPYATFPSNLFCQSSSATLQTVSEEQQLYLPLSTSVYEGPDAIYGAIPAEPFPVTSTSFQNEVPQLSSDCPTHNGVFFPPMDYSSFLADNQQLTQQSNLDSGQGDVVAHYCMDAITFNSQHVPGASFQGIPAMQCQRATTNSYTMPTSENTSVFTKPQLTSAANRKASDARRRRAAKYVCEMCGACLTAKHNLISKLLC